MATSNFQTQKSFSVLLSISLTVFLLLLNKVNATESVSFSFNKFTQNNPNLLLQGDALVTKTGKLQLTKMEDCKPVVYSLGRTLYSAPIHIWDSDTGNVASFKTSFSFVINVPDKAKTTGGLAFFLAPPDTQPQKPGGLLGLFCNQNCNTAKQIVAVEFDTHSNTEWDDDQQGQHIGINVNSIKSIKTASWGFANSQEAKVDISYEASTKVLTATLVHPSSQTSHIVSSVVDLKGVLPEFVRVGFSASTALSEDPFETHDILSWSFSSKLPECISVALESRCLKSSITT